MGHAERYNHAAVPIIGEKPFRILKSYATVVIECQCEGKNIMVLVGKRQAATCGLCGQTYAIGEVGPVEIGILRVDLEPEGVTN
jgi:uncharacterized ParB-like nuclease family protein